MNYSDFSLIKAQTEAGDPVFGGKFDGELTERERHLIGLAVAATKGCPDCTSVRVATARKSGISDQTIKEAINLVAGINSGFVIQTAVKGCGGA
ncbi:MAG: carboxymuconolactone decarboxylase family protein [Sedimentisphaerales bacterium]